MRELTDIELSEVAGGIGNVTTGIVTSTSNSAVVGIQANTGINGGVDNAIAAIMNEQVNVGVAFG
jgi:phosphohistidine swiveling domain-containing protein